MLSASALSACSSNPTSPTATTSLNFVSRLQEKGSAWRSFKLYTAGLVAVQFTSITQSDAVMGLGLGTFDGTNCVITNNVQTAASAAVAAPQITATLPVGNYCVKISDIGNLKTIVDFSVLVTMPY